MLPSTPITGPGVTDPPRSLDQRTFAVCGPVADVAEEWRASNCADGQALAGAGSFPTPLRPPAAAADPRSVPEGVHPARRTLRMSVPADRRRVAVRCARVIQRTYDARRVAEPNASYGSMTDARRVESNP